MGLEFFSCFSSHHAPIIVRPSWDNPLKKELEAVEKPAALVRIATNANIISISVSAFHNSPMRVIPLYRQIQ